MEDQDRLIRRWAPTMPLHPLTDHLHDFGPEAATGPGQDEQSEQEEDGDTLTVLEAESPSEAESLEAQQAQVQHTGVMVALYPSVEHAKELAVAGGEAAEELHVTLAYLGQVGTDVAQDQQADLIQAVAGWAAGRGPLSGAVNGFGVFDQEPPVTYASFDSPQLPAARQELVRVLQDVGLPPRMDHGFIPHITLAYADVRAVTPPRLDITFTDVVVAFAGRRTTIPFGGGKKPEAAPATQLPEAAGTPTQLQGQLPAQWTISWNANGTSANVPISSVMTATTQTFTGVRPSEPEPEPEAEPIKAFVSEINGRTLICAPATAALREPSVDDIVAQHMLWVQGRYVGADEPNRNGALWSAGDLEMGRASVVNGPLNWLHEARHVIGTLASADFIDPTKRAQVADGMGQLPSVRPHIAATAAIWRWIWPDEAYVVEQASDLGQLWYSMECISKEVACSGPDGCGAKTTYAQYMAGAACEHVKERASIRQFINPVFLGGAVIVPPTRPGWAEADARVMKVADGLAEAAFEQAGRPDVTASLWEQMMAQLVRYAEQ